MRNFKALTILHCKFLLGLLGSFFFVFNNFENKAYSSGKYCAKVNDVSEHTSVQFVQSISVPMVSSKLRICTVKNAIMMHGSIRLRSSWIKTREISILPSHKLVPFVYTG